MKEFKIEDGKDALQIVNLLEDRIYEFNSKKIMKYDGSLFAKTVNDEHGILVAGIEGWRWAGVCEITALWVDENVRKNGIGKNYWKQPKEKQKTKDVLRFDSKFQLSTSAFLRKIWIRD